MEAPEVVRLTGRYKIKTISELCGFSPTLLRAWESRHNLLEPVRQPSGHRLYTDDDLRVLRRVSQLLAQGQSIGEIAAAGREALLAGTGEGEELGRVETSFGLAPVEFLKREVVDGAVSIDEARIRRALDRLEILLTRREIVHNVIAVLAREFVSMCVTGKASVASERLLNSLFCERLRRWTAHAGGAEVSGSRVLCAGFPDEVQELGLLIVVYELRGAGHDVVFLGLGIPMVDLEYAIEMVEPQVVCLGVARPVVYSVHRGRFLELVGRHPQISFVVEGAGVTHLEEELSERGVLAWPTHRSLTDLPEALK